MYKFKNTHFVLIVIIAFCAILLSACAKKDNRSVVQFASWGSQSEVEILKPILAEFEGKNPDLKVDFLHIPQNYFQKIHLLFASNLAPDVLFINNLYLPIYANAGVLAPLESNSGDFFDEALNALSYQGKLYAIPRDVSNLVIFYNKNLFDKFDVRYPDKNWTFEDFLRTAQELSRDTNNDGKIDVWGISFEEELYYYLPYLMSEGGGVLSDDLKTPIIDEVSSQKGLNFYADLRKKYSVAPKKSDSASATMAQMFLQQKLAMHLSGRWLVPKYSKDAEFDWDVINFPRGDKGSVVAMDASGWAISKNSRHKDAARRLIDFLASKENSEKFSQSGLIVPARRDVAEGEFLHGKNSPPNNQVFLDVIKSSKKTPVSVNYREIQDELNEHNAVLFN